MEFFENNFDIKTIKSFGEEWTKFNQSKMSLSESQKAFDEYFSIFPWHILPNESVGFDMGCGSGRWAKFVAPKVHQLHCIDPSIAIGIAKENLINFNNIIFHQSTLENSGIPQESMDFGYSLGVLHHIPNTLSGIQSCTKLLKKGAPLLLYLYYAFENRPIWFRTLWKLSDLARRVIHYLPFRLKQVVTDTIAIFIYFPFARISKILEKIGFDVSKIPLSYYRNHTFYTLRTDSLDRFGTPLENRFTRDQIKDMMEKSGLTNIRFFDYQPYWCALGIKL
jgi:SAM-dependent methyltransferase